MPDSIIKGHQYLGNLGGWSVVVENRDDEASIFDELKIGIREYLKFKDGGRRLIYAGCTEDGNSNSSVVLIGESSGKDLFISELTLGPRYSHRKHCPPGEWVKTTRTIRGIYGYIDTPIFKDTHELNPRIFIGIGVALHNYAYGQASQKDEKPSKRLIHA